MKRLIFALVLFGTGAAQARGECFIDGAFRPRCDGGSRFYAGVSYPVFTANNPIDVLREMDRQWAAEAPYQRLVDQPQRILNIPISPKEYPDIICLQWVNGNKTCFYTMEITER